MGSSSEINLNLQPSAEQSNPDLSADQQSKNQQGGDVMEVIRRIYSDNRKLTRMVAEIFQNYSSLHSQLMQYFIPNNDPTEDNPQIRKRKLAEHLDTNFQDDDDDDDNNIYTKMMRCCSCSNEERLTMLNSKPEVSRFFVRVDPSDSSLVVRDGYQWKKYGQKVTRDNPSPRAYFKCSFAPLCPVKKKVQKSAEDPTVLVVTYEAEHTHKKPSSHGSILAPSTIIPSSSLINLSSSSYHISSPDHLIRKNISDRDHKEKNSDQDNIIDDQERSLMHHLLVEQMASSLTKDSSFTSTLAAVISDKILEQTFC